MNCQDIQDSAIAQMDGQLIAAEEEQIVETHLVNCSTCRRDVAIVRATRDVIRHRFPHAVVPEATYESIRQLFVSDYLC